MEESQRDHPREDPVAWARAETAAFTKRKLRRYGLLTLGNMAVMALILKGMPAHALAPVIGIPLAISFACFFAPTLYHGAMLIGEWLDKKQHP
jgi:hypothetical protein